MPRNDVRPESLRVDQASIKLIHDGLIRRRFAK
jgi:hypothetical protein